MILSLKLLTLYNQKMTPIIDIWRIHAVNPREKMSQKYALLQCKTFSLKIWLCKILDKYHVCEDPTQQLCKGNNFQTLTFLFLEKTLEMS